MRSSLARKPRQSYVVRAQTRSFWSCAKVHVVAGADIRGKVVITRSQPGASELADALLRAGFVTLVCPVIDIRANVDPTLHQIVKTLDEFDVVIFVSGHAVRFGMELIDRQWPTRPMPVWVAVGEATARALARYGVAALTPETESSEGILALPQLSSMADQKVLICAGVGGRSLLNDELVRRGAKVERLELYRREPVATERAVKRLNGSGPFAAIVIASAEGARAFAAIWRTIDGDRQVGVVAPSQRVAAELKNLDFQRVVVADGVGAAAIGAALERLTADGES